MFSTREKFLVLYTMGETTKHNSKATLRLRNQEAKRENEEFVLLQKIIILKLSQIFVVCLEMYETLGLRILNLRQYEML